MLLLLAIGCGYDRMELDYAVDVRRREIVVDEREQNAWHSTARDCADVASCREVLGEVVAEKLGSLMDAGATGAAVAVEARGAELDLVAHYALGFDAPILAEAESYVRRVEVETRAGRVREGVVFVDLGRDAASYVATPRGRYRSYTLAGTEDASPRMVVFERGKGGLHIVVEPKDENGAPKHTDPWADDIPGLLDSLTHEPVRRP